MIRAASRRTGRNSSIPALKENWIDPAALEADTSASGLDSAAAPAGSRWIAASVIFRPDQVPASLQASTL